MHVERILGGIASPGEGIGRMSDFHAPEPARRPVAFISHHHSQGEIARKLKNLLARGGIDAWMAPDDVEPGVTFDQAIIDQIDRSDAVILLFSESSDRSRHVKRELMLAEDRGKPVYPVRLENSAPQGLAYWLQDYQWVDWFGGDGQDVSRLIAAIHPRDVQGDRPEPVAPPAGPAPRRTGRRTALLALAAFIILAAAGAVWLLWPGSSEAAFVLRPGRWVSRREVVRITFPDMPPEMAQEVKRAFETDPDPNECIPEEVARAPDVRLFDQRGEGHCTLTGFNMASGRINGYLVCPLPGAADSVMQVTIGGSYTATTIDLENDVTIARPGNLLRFRARDTTRWAAPDCAPAR